MRYIGIILILCTGVFAKAQNGIGVFAEYMYINHAQWNNITAVYNNSDTVTKKLEQIHHLPQAGIVYERKFSEFLYFQLFSGYGYSRTQSKSVNGNLNMDMQLISAGLNTNWYPVKMIKGLKVTALNPLFLRIGFSASYMLTTLKYNGAAVYAQDKKNYSYNQFPVQGIGGIGYDLHFGSRIIFQTVVKATYCPAIEIPEYNYLVPNIETYGYSTEGATIGYGIQFSWVYLFK